MGVTAAVLAHWAATDRSDQAPTSPCSCGSDFPARPDDFRVGGAGSAAAAGRIPRLLSQPGRRGWAPASAARLPRPRLGSRVRDAAARGPAPAFRGRCLAACGARGLRPGFESIRVLDGSSVCGLSGFQLFGLYGFRVLGLQVCGYWVLECWDMLGL